MMIMTLDISIPTVLNNNTICNATLYLTSEVPSCLIYLQSSQP